MPANIVVDSVRFAIASHLSLLEVEFIEELEAYADQGQCTSLFTGIRNISSYFHRALNSDPKCAIHPRFPHNIDSSPTEFRKRAHSRPNPATATSAGISATTTARAGTPKLQSTIFTRSSVACKQVNSSHQVFHTL
jgi:hypothetical protein